MDNLDGKNWHWKFHEADAAILSPWLGDASCRQTVKDNTVRAVFTAKDVAGNQYHVKHSTPQAFWDCLIPHLKREFLVSAELQRHGIDCSVGLAWGKAGSQELLVTRTIPDAISLTSAIGKFKENDPDFCRTARNGLASIVRKLWESGFVHYDLHAGNVLFQTTTKRLFLIDLNAISRRSPLCRRQKAQVRILSKILSNVALFESPRDSLDFILACGFAESENGAETLLDKTMEFHASRDKARFGKRVKKILDGKYFQTTIIQFRGKKTYVRIDANTGEPVKFDVDNPAKVRTMPHNEAEKYWPAAVLKRPIVPAERPAAWIVEDDGNDTIVF